MFTCNIIDDQYKLIEKTYRFIYQCTFYLFSFGRYFDRLQDTLAYFWFSAWTIVLSTTSSVGMTTCSTLLATGTVHTD